LCFVFEIGTALYGSGGNHMNTDWWYWLYQR